MKMLLVCSECFPPKTGMQPTLHQTEVNDDGHYIHTCMYGHTTFIVTQQQKFEILFENGAHAIIDGYYRESILSFTASIERFNEYFIRLISRTHENDKITFDETWKMISSQSERQLGAYVFLYLNSLHETPQLMSQKHITLRNNVAHKGYIPTKAEAILYGQSALSIISKVIEKINIKYKTAIMNETMDKVKRGYETAQSQGLKASTMSTATIISIDNTHSTEKNLTLEIEKLAKHRQAIEQAEQYMSALHSIGANITK
ncbi:hypothetical protein [Lelliottia amnigena]|uniref:hypothetical protein n=1 Tax=Lelliottia amnigena TaxID=61646 RepID=UPI0040579D7B